MKTLLGYNGNPSLTEVLAYLAYWLAVGVYLLKTYRRPGAKQIPNEQV